MRTASFLAVCLFSAYTVEGVHSGLRYLTNPQSINLWRLRNSTSTRQERRLLNDQDDQTTLINDAKKPDYSEFPEQWFEQPLDHFDKNDTHTFNQRYWVNKRHYKKGGPVIVLDGGETSGEDRLPFLDTGIVEILAKATSGLGIVLEHRYYGDSIPVQNFSTDSLRWLNNAQAAADSANFMANVKFYGIGNDLTAPKTPWIYYGGSYAGARAAHMRVLYPELVFGAIASSGVTHATLANWEYHEVIRQAADPACSLRLQLAVAAIDVALSTPHLNGIVKSLFGVRELVHDDDFASLIESPFGHWQGKVWDPEVGSTGWDEFCDALAKPIFGHKRDLLPRLHEGVEVVTTVYNYGKYIQEHYVSKCPEDATVEDCFGSYEDAEKFRDTDLSETWRAWVFQVCTEWGYFSTAPPDSGAPRIVSNRLTLETSSRICSLAFPPGKHFVVPVLPNITAVNVLGDFEIAANRLAIIDGEVDPWRPATPHSQYAPDREDTASRPFKLIPGGVHHYDEYGLRNLKDEPPEIYKIHKEMIKFVKEWLKDFPTHDVHEEVRAYGAANDVL